jgi:prepilin-type N-terminal cleavage/methylation domain-containing protein
MTAWRRRHPELTSHAEPRGEDGFTLIELVIVIIILPIVVGGIAVALIGILQNESTTFNRVADSADAQITSVNFVRDVQNATSLSTVPFLPSSGVCLNSAMNYPAAPPSTTLLSLQWGESNSRTITDGVVTTTATLKSNTADFTPADVGATVSGTDIKGGTTILPWNPQDSSTSVTLSQVTTGNMTGDQVTISLTTNWVVTYWDVPSGTTHELVRMFCSLQGSVPSFVSQEYLSHDLPADQGPATISCAPTVPAAQCTPTWLSSHWVSTAGMTDVSLSSDEPGSGYQFNLSATPRNSNPGSQGTSPGAASAESLLLTSSGPSNLTLANAGSLTVDGQLIFNGTAGSLSGGGSLTDVPGPITEYNCIVHSGSCPEVTSNPQFTGTCSCGPSPTPISSAVPVAAISQPTSPTPASVPTQSCNGANATCQPGYYPGSVTVSGNVSFAPGNYLFANGVTVGGSGSSVTFGTGQYTFDVGLNISPKITVTGDGVFFYFAGTTSSLTVSTGDIVNLTAAPSGPYFGVLVYQPPSNTSQMFLGSGGAVTVNTYGGTVEAPNAPVVLGSNGDDFTIDALVAASVNVGPVLSVTVG